MAKVFNDRAFYRMINSNRGGVAWNKFALRAGISPSGLHAFIRQFEHPELNLAPKSMSLDSIVKILAYVGKTDLAPFMIDEDELQS